MDRPAAAVFSKNLTHAVQNAKKRTRSTLNVALYATAFIVLMSSVAVIYRAPWRQDSASALPAAVAAGSSDGSVDKLLAINLAGSFAESTNLSVSNNLSEASVTMSVDKELALQPRAVAAVVEKPQLVSIPLANRSITTYKTQVGDTVPTVAAKNNISPQTLRWANDLSGDLLAVDTNIILPPTDGVVYTVKDGDSIDSIAKHLSANPARITTFNNLEVAGIKTGDQIIVPGGTLPETERPGYVAPRPAYRAPVSTTPSNASIVNGRANLMAGNRYAFGNCTYYVYNQRAAIGRPIGSSWGDARAWSFSAASAGYTVNRTPEVGAIAQWNAYAGGSYQWGHVGIVESVNADGTVTITEMNNGAYGGFNIVNSRTIPAGDVSNYIH